MPRIAIIGASNNPAKYGNKAVRAYLRRGWTVFPVTPREASVEGIPTHPDVESIPGSLDRVALYVPPSVGIALLPGLIGKGIAEVFVSPGAESDELLAEGERLGLPLVQACSIVEIGERP